MTNISDSKRQQRILIENKLLGLLAAQDKAVRDQEELKSISRALMNAPDKVPESNSSMMKNSMYLGEEHCTSTVEGSTTKLFRGVWANYRGRGNN